MSAAATGSSDVDDFAERCVVHLQYLLDRRIESVWPSNFLTIIDRPPAANRKAKRTKLNESTSGHKPSAIAVPVPLEPISSSTNRISTPYQSQHAAQEFISQTQANILVTAPQVASLGSQFIPTPVDMSVKDPLSQHTFVITTQPLPHTDTAAIAQSYANLRWMHANGVLSPDKPDAASTLSDYDHEEHRDDRDDEITFGSQAPSVLSASALISQSRIVPLRQSTALATLDLNGVQMEQRVSEFVKQLELFISDPPDSAYMSKLLELAHTVIGRYIALNRQNFITYQACTLLPGVSPFVVEFIARSL